MVVRRRLVYKCLVIVHMTHLVLLDLIIVWISEVAGLRVLKLAIVLFERGSCVGMMFGVVWKGRCAVLPGRSARDINVDLITCLTEGIVEGILKNLSAMGGILSLFDSTRLHVLLLVLQLLHLVTIILLNKGFDSV